MLTRPTQQGWSPERSKLLARAIEDGYQTSMMQHKYPFTLFYVQMDGEAVDVNVHPTKMELRFSHQEEIYRQMRDMISGALNHREQIVNVSLSSDRERKAEEKAARRFGLIGMMCQRRRAIIFMMLQTAQTR